MKVGFIVECADEGPETRVLPILVSLIDESIDLEIQPLINKSRLLQECGHHAKALLEYENCDRVVILWDARPAWKEGEVIFDTEGEKEKAQRSLRKYGLGEDARVNVLCIQEELEAWLLADGRGVTSRINRLRGSRGALRSRISDFKNVERIDWPKATMERLFRQHHVRPYSDWHDAGFIAAGIPSTNKMLRHSVIFMQFCQLLE